MRQRLNTRIPRARVDPSRQAAGQDPSATSGVVRGRPAPSRSSRRKSPVRLVNPWPIVTVPRSLQPSPRSIMPDRRPTTVRELRDAGYCPRGVKDENESEPGAEAPSGRGALLGDSGLRRHGRAGDRELGPGSARLHSPGPEGPGQEPHSSAARGAAGRGDPDPRRKRGETTSRSTPHRSLAGSSWRRRETMHRSSGLRREKPICREARDTRCDHR